MGVGWSGRRRGGVLRGDIYGWGEKLIGVEKMIEGAGGRRSMAREKEGVWASIHGH